jgi:hypothetical protein
MTIHEAGDTDWVSFHVETAGVTLETETHSLLKGIDTVMEPWRLDSSGAPVTAATDDGSGGQAGASAIACTSPEARGSLLRVHQEDPSGRGSML